MSLEKRIKSFVKLGLFLNQFKSEEKDATITAINNQFYDEFEYHVKHGKCMVN